jgi:hypothetical protein
MSRDFDLSTWLDCGAERPAADKPFLEVTKTAVRVGEVLLPVRRDATRHPLAPDPAAFTHFCTDAPTAETLDHVARSVLLGEPCLLEGPTGSAKTSAVLYLAALTAQPVIAIPCSGQLDTADLVGRHVPSGMAASGGWAWLDGHVLKAMDIGAWLLLEEVNLAEAALLERINSILDLKPSFVVSEHAYEVIGGADRPVHPAFRVAATQNPARGYAGRNPMSPAWLDRWRAHRYVDAPRMPEYHALAKFLVYGSQPDVIVNGARYRGAKMPAPLADLAAFPIVARLLAPLALFHSSLAEAAAGEGVDASKFATGPGSPPVITRRGYLSFFYFLRDALKPEPRGSVRRTIRLALKRYYVDALSSDAQREVVLRLLDAAGIGPNTWSIGES